MASAAIRTAMGVPRSWKNGCGAMRRTFSFLTLHRRI
jgi:hypothetical protein